MELSVVIALFIGVIVPLIGWAVFKRMDRLEQRMDASERRNQERVKELHERINPIAEEVAAYAKLVNERK